MATKYSEEKLLETHILKDSQLHVLSYVRSSKQNSTQHQQSCRNVRKGNTQACLRCPPKLPTDINATRHSRIPRKYEQPVCFQTWRLSQEAINTPLRSDPNQTSVQDRRSTVSSTPIALVVWLMTPPKSPLPVLLNACRIVSTFSSPLKPEDTGLWARGSGLPGRRTP
jgi:hypothetical protein